MLIIERLFGSSFRKRNKFGVKVFYDADLLTASQDFKDNYSVIRMEYDNLIKKYEDFAPFQKISPHQTYISNDDKWRLFFLRGAGIWFRRNCGQMPNTAKILRKHPYIISAYISVLGPHKKLNPHSGPYSGVLRLHLALDVPEPDLCHINVGGQVGRWEEGKLLFFDDTYNHFAVNDSDKIRSVLFMDVLKPLPFHLHFINRLIIRVSRIFPYVWIPLLRHKKWERNFYAKDRRRKKT